MFTLGVKKNNDNSNRHYFSSNKHDASGEMIRSKYQQEALQQGVWGSSYLIVCLPEEKLQQSP